MQIMILGIPEATQADLDRGAAAALGVFNAAGVTASDCADAQFKRSRIDDLGIAYPEDADGPEDVMTKEEFRLAALWDKAEKAGLLAAANGTQSAAAHGWLKLDDEIKGEP